MSTHTIPAGTDIDRARVLLARYLRQPSGIIYANGLAAAPTAIEFVPDLSAAEQNVLADIAAACRLESDPTGRAADNTTAQGALASLQAYVDLASPTTAQTTAAVKLLCRVCIVLIKRSLGVS